MNPWDAPEPGSPDATPDAAPESTATRASERPTEVEIDRLYTPPQARRTAYAPPLPVAPRPSTADNGHRRILLATAVFAVLTTAGVLLNHLTRPGPPHPALTLPSDAAEHAERPPTR